MPAAANAAAACLAARHPPHIPCVLRPPPPCPPGLLQVVYETLPGWKQDISGVRRWEDLPPAARDYCQWIEDRLGVHCKWIGVGPGRDAVVVKPLGR